MRNALRLAVFFLLGALITSAESNAQFFKAADDAASEAGLGFGRAVTAGGGQLIASEYRTTDAPGAVFVYDTSIEGDWVQRQKLEASDKAQDDGFGYAVAVSSSGTRLVATSVNTGSAYVFEREVHGDWIQTAILVPSDSTEADLFGRAVAVNDSAVVVGASRRHDSGAVYVFKRDQASDEWQQAELIDNYDSGSMAGTAVTFAGDYLAVGAPRANASVGHVYVYERSSGGSYQIADTLVGQGSGSFGYSISGTEGRVIVGDYLFENTSGRVVFFTLDDLSNSWTMQSSIDSPDASAAAWFGFSVHMDADGTIVGAPYGKMNQVTTGIAYTFVENESLKWQIQAILFGSEAESFDFLGVAVGISGSAAVVGASGDDNSLGGAYVFERENLSWTEAAYLFQESAVADITGSLVQCEQGFAGDFPCQDVDLVSFLSTTTLGGERGAGVNDIWGWTDSESGHEYAIVGRSDGTSFVDVTDPLSPVVIGSLPTNTVSSSWSDVKVYSNHAFIVSEANGHGMQVFDLTRLRAAGSTPILFDADAVYDGFGRAHNVVVNEESGFAFGVGTNSTACPRGLHMVDISDPKSPAYAGCFRDLATGRGSDGYTHDAQCVIYHGPDNEHDGKEICIGANETHISVADVTSKSSPIVISNATYPTASYVHQGWLSDDHRYFYQNDELDETGGSVATTTTFIWDLVDLDDPQLVGTHVNTTASTDHNLYVHAGKLYQSNYSSGLRILDLSDPIVPVEEAYFDVFPAHDHAGFEGTWSNYPYFASGNIIVTGRNLGLFVLARSADPVAVEVGPDAGTAGIAGFYPNPFAEDATIRLRADRRVGVGIHVYDILGRLQLSVENVVAEEGDTELSIDLSGLPRGTYVVRVSGVTDFGSIVVVKAR